MPGVDVRFGVAEALPWADDTFDCAAAQLVVHLMTDPLAGISEMARVTRPGGTVAATVWDFSGDTADERDQSVRPARSRFVPVAKFTTH